MSFLVDTPLNSHDLMQIQGYSNVLAVTLFLRRFDDEMHA